MKYTIYIYDQCNTRWSTRMVTADSQEEANEKALISYCKDYNIDKEKTPHIHSSIQVYAEFMAGVIKALDTGIAAINQIESKEGEK